jgi:hypothetical protein
MEADHERSGGEAHLGPGPTLPNLSGSPGGPPDHRRGRRRPRPVAPASPAPQKPPPPGRPGGGLVHGNTARAPANKTPDELKQRVLDLATTTYAQFNFSHLADVLHEEHNILLSDETLRRWLRPLGHGRPPRRGKHRRRRTRREREGELLFLDGSPHPWFGPACPACCLLLCSDDATGKPLRGQFQPEEDRDGCFEVCYHVFTRFGRPGAFYLDRASQFVTTRYGGVRALHDPDREPTHFENAMRQLKVGLIFAYSPQARGRGERLNGTFQDRLVAELGRHRITTARRATEYLNTSFIPRYGRRFGRAPADERPFIPVGTLLARGAGRVGPAGRPVSQVHAGRGQRPHRAVRGPRLPVAAAAALPEPGAVGGRGAAVVRRRHPLRPRSLRHNPCQAPAAAGKKLVRGWPGAHRAARRW